MHTKITATVGPRCDSAELIHGMVEAGMDIARMNFSHCTPEEFLQRQKLIRTAEKKLKRTVSLLQDLQGPRIRVGKLPDESIVLEEGVPYVFSHDAQKSASPCIPIDDPYLHLDIKSGDPFYLANGSMELVVTSVRGGRITAQCLRGGTLFSRKGINVPQTRYQRGALTPKDIADAKFGAAHGVDYMGLSFVQTADDVVKLRKALGTSKVKIIAKIERAVALEHIDEIIRVSDGIMVARGDLGIEIPAEDVPIVQKNLIRQAHWHGKPVMVATQMLLSMIASNHPTRAEVSDVANAVFERADALCLSDETANGAYPVEAVKTMRRIITRIDHFLHQDNFFASSQPLAGVSTYTNV